MTKRTQFAYILLKIYVFLAKFQLGGIFFGTKPVKFMAKNCYKIACEMPDGDGGVAFGGYILVGLLQTNLTQKPTEIYTFLFKNRNKRVDKDHI